MVDLCHQLDEIYNQLGNTSRGVSRRVFLERPNEPGKTHSKCRWYHFLGWGPRLSQLAESELLGSLLPHFEGNMTLDSFSHYFPTTRDCTSLVGGLHPPFFRLILILGIQKSN